MLRCNEIKFLKAVCTGWVRAAFCIGEARGNESVARTAPIFALTGTTCFGKASVYSISAGCSGYDLASSSNIVLGRLQIFCAEATINKECM